MVTTPTFWGTQVIFSSATNTGNSKATGLLDNNFAITWQNSLGDIQGRRFDSLGSFNSTDFLFNMTQNTTQEVRSPELIQQRDGAMGVYFNLTFGPGDGDIYINVPDFATAGGSGTKLTVLTSSTDEFMRDVTATEFNNVPNTAIVSVSPRGTTGVTDVYLSHLTPGGLVIGSPQIVPINAGETVNDARVTGLPNGNTLVVYETFNASTSERFIRYRVYDDYTDITGPRHASSTPGNDTFPAATALTNSSDGFVIVTQDPLGLRFLYSAYGQAFTKSVPGTLSSGGGAFAKAIGPRVTPLDDGGFIVAWVDTTAIEGDGSPDLKVVLQRFDKNSNAVGQNLIINNPGDQSLESIATLDDGRVILTYTTETGDSTGQTRLAYRIIDPREPTIYGTSRADNIVGRQDGSTIISGIGDDTLIGSAVADTLQGETGADTLDGAGGDDILIGGPGSDILIGGIGKDTYVLENGTDNVTDISGIDTITSTITRTLSGLYSEIENLTLLGSANIAGTGNSFVNQITGNARNNVLDGVGNGDTLNGGAGNDKLIGGIGLDQLHGGKGLDSFVFDVALTNANRDIIHDFNVGNDTMHLDNAVFTRVGPVGALSPSVFKLSTQVKDADDRIIYNKTTGGVFYDSDGSGNAAPILFATLMNKPVVTAADFVVI